MAYMFNICSYNAIKSYKTEGRAEQLEPLEYLVSAAEAGKAIHSGISRLDPLGGHGYPDWDWCSGGDGSVLA